MDVYRSEVSIPIDCDAPHFSRATCRVRRAITCCGGPRGVWFEPEPRRAATCNAAGALEAERWRRAFRWLAATSIATTAGLAGMVGLLGAEHLRMIDGLPAPPAGRESVAQIAHAPLRIQRSGPMPERRTDRFARPDVLPPLLAQIAPGKHDVSALAARARDLERARRGEVVFKQLYIDSPGLERLFDAPSKVPFPRFFPALVDGVHGIILPGQVDSAGAAAAHLVGLQTRDVLVGIDGYRLDHPEDLLVALSQAKDEHRALLELQRGARRMIFDVVWDR